MVISKLLLILILTFSFQSWSKADDISDFQIEGMSVGDSLLDHANTIGISKDQIYNKKLFYYPKSKKYGGIAFSDRGFYNTYKRIQFTINPVTFIIEDISGIIAITNKEDCEQKQKKIFKELSGLFKSAKIDQDPFIKHSFDKSGVSEANGFYLDFKNGDEISVECYLWSKEIRDERNWDDNLKVTIRPKKMRSFLQNEAY
tara:strand:+ start:701 stop:1303 length:603 start_codon:yes stop_codon:yes gene_type:complete